MPTLYESALEAKVAARNTVHEHVRLFVPQFQAALTPFVGTKIELAGGGLKANVRKAIPTIAGIVFPDWCHIKLHRYSISLDLRVAVNYKGRREGDQFTLYAEASVYIASTDSQGKLVKIDPFNPDAYRTDYSLNEVLAARQDYKVAADLKNKAEAKLAHFGLHDN